MEKYKEYKDSGIPTIPKIPKHWEVNSLGPLLSAVSEKNKPSMDLLSITREKGVIQRDVEDDSENHNYIPDDLSGYKLLREGQFGMNKMKAWQGSYGVSKFDGIVSPAYYVFDFTKPIDPDFFHVAIRSKRYISYFGEASDGVRIGQWDLSKVRMRQIPFITPPKEEQTAIATFLDRKTAQVDQAIAQKERLIALLRERKQIVIQQAVTKGLDPTVKMKDSGVEWIGEVPEGWTIKRIKQFTYVQSGVTLGKRYSAGTISVPYLRVANVQDGFFNLKVVKTLNIPSDEARKYELRTGDLLVTEGGDIDKLGRGAIWDGSVSPCIHQNHIFAVRSLDERIDMSFVSLAFGADYGRYYFTHTANKTTNLASTNSTKLGNFVIALPPQEEIRKILRFVEFENSKIDQSIHLHTQQIAKLKEYRTVLIDAAVTGKIRVE